jgi:hypothetical protein
MIKHADTQSRLYLFNGGATTLSIMTLSITKHTLTTISITNTQHNYTQHNIFKNEKLSITALDTASLVYFMLTVVMCSVFYADCRK